MKTITARASGQKTKVWIGNHILSKMVSQLAFGGGTKKAFIISDQRVKVQAKALSLSLKKRGWLSKVMLVQASESLKDFHSIYPIYGKLLDFGADRGSVIFAVGGGVIGDAAGFVASTFLRGIPWVGVPSTLLAQVDSTLGGKTGINHEKGKNLVGTFHYPSFVICDTAFLDTLPARDRVSGLGEILKYGLVFDRKFYCDLEREWKKVLRLAPSDRARVDQTIYRCLKWKSKVVSQDPCDLQGKRELLNFGHTFAHALEAETGYGYLRHGEAVVWGMRAALFLSAARGHMSQKEREQVDAFLAEIPVPPIPRTIQESEISKRLALDKKSRNGQVRFVLLKKVGQPVLDRGVPPDLIAQTARWLLKEGRKRSTVSSRSSIL